MADWTTDITVPGVRRAHRNLLSLDEYADVMGLDALRVAGGNSDVRPAGRCDDIWYEFDWQDDADKVGRWELLSEIAVAEEDIAKTLRWWPGPVWISNEEAAFPRFSQRPESGAWARSLMLSTAWAKVRGLGALTEITIDSACVSREDDVDGDGDGFTELAHFIITCPDCVVGSEVRAYFKEYDATDAENCRIDPASLGPDPIWEVWPLTCVTDTNSIHVYVKTWWLFKPQLRYGMAPAIIDADDSDSYVDTLQFYCQTQTTPSARIAWLNSADSCVGATADICASIGNATLGLLQVPSSELWAAAAANSCAGVPNLLHLWYTAGEPILTHFWAEMIAILATSRLPRPLCSCNPVSQRVQWWQTDLAYTGEEGGHMTSPATLSNPFGTRRGEDWVWKRIQKYRIPARPYLG